MQAKPRTSSRGGRRRPSSATAPWATTLQQAIAAHQAGELDRAERLYGQVLAQRAGQPDALHFLGVLSHQRGRSEEAVRLIEAALKLLPRHPDAHNNLGNVHKECERLADAERCYRRALACDPAHYHAISNLAVVLEAQDQLDEAFAHYVKLLEQAPDYAHGHYRMGLFLRNHAQHAEHLEQAAQCFREAYRCDPRNVRALEGVGVVLYVLNRHGEAAEVYRQWLAREPGNPVPRHMLAACGAAEAPARAADDYVRDVFDGFADSFDEQLINNLGYRAPGVLVGMLDEVVPAEGAALDVLDAGCGTGLCAPLLRERAGQLVGVDLSGGMIDKARARGGYDVLEVAELTAWLDARPDAYDLIVSADTLVYFGDLVPVLGAAFRSLRPGGWIGYTLEAAPDDALDRPELSASGRYRHGRRYVERTLADAGFSEVVVRADTLRQEAGQPVPGWVVRARRAPAAAGQGS